MKHPPHVGIHNKMRSKQAFLLRACIRSRLHLAAQVEQKMMANAAPQSPYAGPPRLRMGDHNHLMASVTH